MDALDILGEGINNDIIRRLGLIRFSKKKNDIIRASYIMNIDTEYILYILITIFSFALCLYVHILGVEDIYRRERKILGDIKELEITLGNIDFSEGDLQRLTDILDKEREERDRLHLFRVKIGI